MCLKNFFLTLGGGPLFSTKNLRILPPMEYAIDNHQVVVFVLFLFVLGVVILYIVVVLMLFFAFFPLFCKF